jgi:hypothetical protein
MKLTLDMAMGDEELDDTPLSFGKHKGETPDEISDYDPEYIVWAYENLDIKICSKAMYEYCKE